ncbi:hypothetical protein GGR55DRAFT_667485 [Xylaria sp. FL0064]|nr:hypothetical protein GGR55DRAFT_667485 [Xylaria sp. FL0064]
MHFIRMIAGTTRPIPNPVSRLAPIRLVASIIFSRTYRFDMNKVRFRTEKREWWREKEKKMAEEEAAKPPKQSKFADLKDTSPAADPESNKPYIKSKEEKIRKQKLYREWKKHRKQVMRDLNKNEDGDDGAEGVEDPAERSAPLFAIDTKPTPVDFYSKFADVRGENPLDEYGPEKIKPPSGLNRQTRRRIELIEKQRIRIRNKMGIPEGSREKEDEVQKELDKWTRKYDTKVKDREKKKKERKARERIREKNKRNRKMREKMLKDNELMRGIGISQASF